MGLTGFNRTRRQGVYNLVGDSVLAEQLIVNGYNEPSKVKAISSKSEVSFLSDSQRKKLFKTLDSAPAEGELPEDLPWRKYLLQDGRYDTAEAVHDASVEELADVKYISESRAEEIKSYYGG